LPTQAAVPPIGDRGEEEPDRRIHKVVLAIGAVVVLGAVIFAVMALGPFSSSSDPDPRALADDAQAKATARTAQTAMETYVIDNGGSYAGATTEALQEIEDTLFGADLEVLSATTTGYELMVRSETGNKFTISRAPLALQTEPEFSCVDAGEHGCPESGDWSQ